jgi:O-antigen/teichoic acid export membrane protein
LNKASKNIARLLPVIKNAAFLVAPGFVNQLLSIIIIRYYTDEWWGKIVELQLVFYFVTSVCAWGNKEFLLREFSRHPFRITDLFQRSARSRAIVLLVPSVVILFFLYPVFISVNLVCWVGMRFIAQSYESLITYEKKFNAALWSEYIALAFLCGGALILHSSLTFNSVLLLLSCSYVLRTGFLAVSFRTYTRNFSGSVFDPSMLKEAAVFMLLAFTGLVQTKIDLFILDMLMKKSDLSKYQVITNFVILIKMCSAFLLYPYLKNIYRVHKSKIPGITNMVLLYGIPITLAGLLVQYLFLHYVYRYTSEPLYYVFGLLSALPAFWFGPVVFYLFRQNRQMDVVWINIAGIVSNSICCIVFIPLWGISGGLLANALAQLCMLGSYVFLFRKLLAASVPSPIDKLSNL